MEAMLRIEAAAFDHPWSRQLLTEELHGAGARNFVFRESSGAGVIAYICFRLILDEMHISRVAVALSLRGRGIGRRMMAESITYAIRMKATVAYLEVRPSNRAAMALYLGLGFHEVGRRKGYYAENGEDALVLTKNLKEE